MKEKSFLIEKSSVLTFESKSKNVLLKTQSRIDFIN